MLSTQSDFRARHVPNGIRLSNSEGKKIDIEVSDDRVILQGDGFSHSIRSQHGMVCVESLDGKEPKTCFPKLDILEDGRRVALGVASTLIGVPVNLLTGEKPEPVYGNLAFRPGMGMRSNGSRKGARFRVMEMERQLQGDFTVHVGRDRVGKVRMLRDSYHSNPATYLASQSGRPLYTESAFFKMTGNQFGETVQSGIAEIWREAGKPGSAAQAAGVANYVFDLAYEYQENYAMYQSTEHSQALLSSLNSAQKNQETWGLLTAAATNKSDAQELLKMIAAPHNP